MKEYKFHIYKFNPLCAMEQLYAVVSIFHEEYSEDDPPNEESIGESFPWTGFRVMQIL